MNFEHVLANVQSFLSYLIAFFVNFNEDNQLQLYPIDYDQLNSVLANVNTTTEVSTFNLFSCHVFSNRTNFSD